VEGYKNARVQDLMMKELSDGEKGYIAGLVDGEAWVGVTRRKLRGLKRPCYSPRIIMTNTSRKAIEWLKETLGYGCVYEGKRKANHRWKTDFQWKIGAESIPVVQG